MPTELPRLSVTFMPDEWDALHRFAGANGMRPAEAVHMATVAMLAAGGTGTEQADAASLAAAAHELGQGIARLAAVLPAAERVAEAHHDMRAELGELADYCGTTRAMMQAAGLIEEEPDSFGEGAARKARRGAG